MRVLLFNPETEYALASGASFYTPPASVIKLRHQLQLLPEKWATPDDFILVEDASGVKSDFNIVEWDDLEELFKKYPGLTVDPWGWNHALIRRLTDAGVPASCLPSGDEMNLIRKLASRETTVTLNKLWNEAVSDSLKVDVPAVLSSQQKCMDFYDAVPGCWMKAPWSSSGRGVINTAADMTRELVGQWCHGILRRQGALIGETPCDSVGDFATEWMMSDGMARFLGVSHFETSRRGKYISNFKLSQQEIIEKFDAISIEPLSMVISLQKDILEKTLNGYSGPCGADMMVDRCGGVRPFVELNLRRTMGMLYL